MSTPLEVSREALAQIGTRSKITSLADGSAEAQYVNLLYGPLRDFLLTQGDHDWSVGSSLLVEIGTGPFPWFAGYTYPTGALRIRQLFPFTPVPFDPRPIEWMVKGSNRVIYASEKVGLAYYTVAASEAVWDAVFRQSFVRMLGSALAFALENRIEASKVKMEEALNFAGLSNMRDM
jgi:hypothetical protein